jgi:mono/diheme cytochrome c family protein
LRAAKVDAPSATQRIAHTMTTLKCYVCHVRDGVGGVTSDRAAFFISNAEDAGDEGRLPPRLDGVGDRLRPAWLAKVLAQGERVRPYVETRMPQFGAANVGHLTELFVAVDRQAQPVVTAPDAPEALRDAGRKLVGTDGLSCIACHRFNRQPAHSLQMVDLITVPERLNEDWFRRFLRDPNIFHPGTRMPALWPGGTSLIPTVLTGDTNRQHAALWAYFSEGQRAVFPNGLSRKSMEIVVGGEAVIYRGRIWEAGFRSIATGYPGQVNAAFDGEEMRLALMWRGRFLDVSPHWSQAGRGDIRPLGSDVMVFPHGSPLAVLADVGAAWPLETSKELGMKWNGYRVDALKRPTLLYSFRGVPIEDLVSPLEVGKKMELHRAMTFTGPLPVGLHLRLAVGKIVPAEDHAWRINDALTLTITGGGKPFVRGKGEAQELLVPLQFQDHEQHLEVLYAW